MKNHVKNYIFETRKSKIYLAAGKLTLIIFFITLYNIYLMHFFFIKQVIYEIFKFVMSKHLSCILIYIRM